MRPVRSIFTAILVASLPVYAVASGSATTSREVASSVERPPLEGAEGGDATTVSVSARGTIELLVDESIQVHPRRDELARACRAPYAVNGCTDFPTETLECRCELRGASWHINASAHLKAVIHVDNGLETTRILAHEQAHLADLTESLRAHLEPITAREYASEQDCERFASFLSTSAHLRIVANDIRVKSNEKFGCSRVRLEKASPRHGRR